MSATLRPRRTLFEPTQSATLLECHLRSFLNLMRWFHSATHLSRRICAHHFLSTDQTRLRRSVDHWRRGCQSWLSSAKACNRRHLETSSTEGIAVSNCSRLTSNCLNSTSMLSSSGLGWSTLSRRSSLRLVCPSPKSSASCQHYRPEFGSLLVSSSSYRTLPHPSQTAISSACLY